MALYCLRDYFIDLADNFWLLLMKDNEGKQTTINFYTNIVTLVIHICVGIYYTPYLVGKLGLAAYGILPLALIINQYISVATGVLTHSYTRFYSIALREGDYVKATQCISTSLYVVFSLVLILSPFIVAIIYNIEKVFNIPFGLIVDAKLLFTYTILSFFLSLLSSILNVTLYALNRLDLMNILKIIRTVLKLPLTICCFEFFSVNIAYVGLVGLVSEFVVLVVSWYFFVRHKPHDVQISLYQFDKALLFSILAMSLWVLIHQCGDTLLYRTDNLIVNHYWGTVKSGALGAVSELGGYIMTVVSVVGSLFGPLILAAYAEKKHEKVVSLALSQSYIVGSLSAILAGTVAGLGSSLLSVWIGNQLSDYSIWLALKMIVVPFYAAGGILAYVYRAWNQVKYPAIATILLGAVDIVTVVVVVNLVEVSYIIEVVLSINAIVSIIQCFFINSYFVNKIYKGCSLKLLIVAVKILLIFMVSYCLGRLLLLYFKVDTWPLLVFCLIVVSVMTAIMMFFVFFSSEERKQLINLIKL